MIRVIVTDDHPLLRQGLRTTLEQDPEISVVGETSTGATTLQLVRSVPFDVLILDISLPDTSGLEVLRQVLASAPESRILMLSTFTERQYAVRSIRLGAMGYLTKASATTELLTAVRRIHFGRRYVSSDLADGMTDQAADQTIVFPHEGLTDREFQVFLLLGSGKNIQDISRELSLSPPSVYTYRSRIYFKTGLTSVPEIVKYVVEHGLLRVR